MDPRNEATRPLLVFLLRKWAILDIIFREYDGTAQFSRDGAILLLDEKRHDLVPVYVDCRGKQARTKSTGGRISHDDDNNVPATFPAQSCRSATVGYRLQRGARSGVRVSLGRRCRPKMALGTLSSWPQYGLLEQSHRMICGMRSEYLLTSGTELRDSQAHGHRMALTTDLATAHEAGRRDQGTSPTCRTCTNVAKQFSSRLDLHPSGAEVVSQRPSDRHSSA
jgi:hypothetical protein